MLSKIGESSIQLTCFFFSRALFNVLCFFLMESMRIVHRFLVWSSLGVHVLVGGAICPSFTSAALAVWSCCLCFSSLFSVLVWGLPSIFFGNFRRTWRWLVGWVAWVAITNAFAEQVTHTTSTSSSVRKPKLLLHFTVYWMCLLLQSRNSYPQEAKRP